jgi:hypothetical protein
LASESEVSPSSAVVESIIDLCETDPSHAFAYFFFDARDSQKELQLHESLMRSLVFQFATQCDGIPAPLVELYNNGHPKLSANSFQNTLQQILSRFPHAYVIIDSLDECSDRAVLLNSVEKICSWKTGNLHLLVTSRQERDIEDRLRLLDPVCIPVGGDSANRDIETYLDQILQTDPKLNRWDSATQSTIKITLMEGAQGMCVLFMC